MKVWIVEVGWDYEGGSAVAVFSSKEAAEAYEPVEGYDDIEIKEMTVDAPEA